MRRLVAAFFFLRTGSDGRDLVAHGSPPWLLVVFGIAAIAAGLWPWNGPGPYFGLGPAHGKVDRRAALGTAAALAIVLILEIAL